MTLAEILNQAEIEGIGSLTNQNGTAILTIKGQK